MFIAYQYNRVDRSGDVMEGDLDFSTKKAKFGSDLDITGSTAMFLTARDAGLGNNSIILGKGASKQAAIWLNDGIGGSAPRFIFEREVPGNSKLLMYRDDGATWGMRNLAASGIAILDGAQNPLSIRDGEIDSSTMTTGLAISGKSKRVMTFRSGANGILAIANDAADEGFTEPITYFIGHPTSTKMVLSLNDSTTVVNGGTLTWEGGANQRFSFGDDAGHNEILKFQESELNVLKSGNQIVRLSDNGVTVGGATNKRYAFTGGISGGMTSYLEGDTTSFNFKIAGGVTQPFGARIQGTASVLTLQNFSQAGDPVGMTESGTLRDLALSKDTTTGKYHLCEYIDGGIKKVELSPLHNALNGELSGSFGSGGVGYVDTNLGAYTGLGRFIFPGTTAFGTPATLNVIARTDLITVSGDIRIYDVTNAQVIGTSGVVNTITGTIFTIALANLPTGQAIFRIDGRVTAGVGSIRVNAFEVNA